MKVIFIGDPIELERGESLSRLSTSMYGITFPMQAEVDVSHLSEVQQRKLLNNSHFRAAGVDAPPAKLILPVGAQAAPLVAEAPAEAGEGDFARRPGTTTVIESYLNFAGPERRSCFCFRGEKCEQ